MAPNLKPRSGAVAAKARSNLGEEGDDLVPHVGIMVAYRHSTGVVAFTLQAFGADDLVTVEKQVVIGNGCAGNVLL